MTHRPSPGLHHVTAISGDPAINRRFYNETLGLRFVKKTVNFDDPGTYHLYYGDRVGQPGTALTFFAFATVEAARAGAGEARRLTWRVPPGALGYWRERLAAAGLDCQDETRFDETRLVACDPHGFEFALVEGPDPSILTWPDSPVPGDAQLHGFHGIDIVSRAPESTRGVLEDVLGYQLDVSEQGWQRYTTGGEADRRSVIDLAVRPGDSVAASGRGAIHHIAFRAFDTTHQAELAAAARDHGLHPTPVIDRQYFESVYFREPGGVLFEIATDAPGFTVDEPEAELGTALRLPPQYEPRRAIIEAELPPI